MSDAPQVDIEDYIADTETKSETLDVAFEYKAEEEEGTFLMRLLKTKEVSRPKVALLWEHNVDVKSMN